MTLPRVGVEVELMAPPGSTRRDLAAALVPPGGRIEPLLHADSEPSLVPGTPVFENLTLGFAVSDAAGRPIARLVDDLTLQDDLDRQAIPRPGWWRVVGDDRRLLHLVRRHGRADAGPDGALAPLAALFGVEVERLPGGLRRVRDPDGMPIALAAPLPGERERACEVVTPPLGPLPRAQLCAALEALLAPARQLGFFIPGEAAVHLHLDAAPLRDAATFARTVGALHRSQAQLRATLGTNRRCRRLSPFPPPLLQMVDAPGFASLPWGEARARLRTLGLTKYMDFNLRGVVHDVPGKPTFEVRILPGADRAEPIVAGLEAVLEVLRPLGVYR
jgi:hypothetical protein